MLFLLVVDALAEFALVLERSDIPFLRVSALCQVLVSRPEAVPVLGVWEWEAGPGRWRCCCWLIDRTDGCALPLLRLGLFRSWSGTSWKAWPTASPSLPPPFRGLSPTTYAWPSLAVRSRPPFPLRPKSGAPPRLHPQRIVFFFFFFVLDPFLFLFVVVACPVVLVNVTLIRALTVTTNAIVGIIAL